MNGNRRPTPGSTKKGAAIIFIPLTLRPLTPPTSLAVKKTRTNSNDCYFRCQLINYFILKNFYHIYWWTYQNNSWNPFQYFSWNPDFGRTVCNLFQLYSLLQLLISQHKEQIINRYSCAPFRNESLLDWISVQCIVVIFWAIGCWGYVCFVGNPFILRQSNPLYPVLNAISSENSLCRYVWCARINTK